MIPPGWLSRTSLGIKHWHWFLLGSAAIVFGVVLHLSGATRPLDNIYTDAWHRQAGVRKVPKHVALVVIDDKALLDYRDDPLVFWTKHYATAVATLRQLGAAVIGFDMIFAVSPEAWLKRMASNEGAARTWDAPFRRELNSGKVVLIGSRIVDDPSGGHRLFLPHEDYLLALPNFDFASYVGLANLDATDRVVRRFSTTLDLRIAAEEKDAALPRLTFPALLAVHAVGADPKASKWMIGGREITQSHTGIPLFYAGPPGTMSRVPFSSLMAPGAIADDSLKGLRGKVVIIGGDWGGDQHATPYSSSLTGAPAQFMLGAEIHANAVESLLSGDRNRVASALEACVLIMLAVSAVVALFVILPWRWAAGAFALTCATLPALSYAAFQTHVLLPVSSAQLAMVATLMCALIIYIFSESRERRRIRSLFGRYVSDAAVERLAKQGGEPDMGGESTPVTVLFSDIRDFTRMSERLDPKAVVDLLNSYFEGAAEAVLSEGGSIDKFIGDSIMAEFGTPEHSAHHARDALRAALKMQRHAENFAIKFKMLHPDPQLPLFKIGIGVHTGEAVVGRIGTRRRSEFTVVGDAVNVAAGVVGLSREIGADILATSECIAACDGQFETEDRGLYSVKGHSEAVRIFVVHGIKSKV